MRRLTKVVITTILNAARSTARSRFPTEGHTAMPIRHTSSAYHTPRRARHIVPRAACYQTRVSAMRAELRCAAERRVTGTALARGTRHHGVHVATGLVSHASAARPGYRRPSD